MGRGRGENDGAFFMERSHDYDPNWDYAVLEEFNPQAAIVADLAREATDVISKELLPQLRLFSTFECHLVEPGELGEHMARYCSGTESAPVIVIDHKELYRSAEEQGHDIGTELWLTVLHELGHARQEAMGLEMDEDDAEDFARTQFRLLSP